MKKFLLFLCLVAGPGVSLCLAQRVDVREETLGNGMKLLMVERHESPTIACGWVARVGSVNERPGITGISHLFEHMMFKGTPTIGTTNHEKGMEIQRQQDAIRDKMEVEYRQLRDKIRRGEVSGNIYDPENMTAKLKSLREELEVLFEEEKKLIVKDELDQIYTQQGGSGLNAFTTEDQTVYMVNLPANKLELWFWLESDRLLNPVFREFYSERDVVREERRLRVESTPTGKLSELFDAMFWQSAPYSWPVIGWASDVESINRAEAEQYFDTYYSPNNITAVLVGDFDSDEALSLAKRYFERIPRGRIEPPEMVTAEIEQLGQKRFTGEAESNTQVMIRYHTPPFNHADNFALEILADLLNGRTGRLYKSLVEEKGIAVGQPYAALRQLKYGGFLQVGAEVKEGNAPETVEAALLGEVQKLQDELLEDRELQKVKNQEMADSFRRLGSGFYLLIQLAIYDSSDSWTYINEAPHKVQSVTAAEVQGVAKKYLKAENRNTAIYIRKGDVSADDEALAGLPPQARASLKQQIAQIQKSEDINELTQVLQQTQQLSEQVPPQMKPAVQYIIQKVQERLTELENKGSNKKDPSTGTTEKEGN